MSLRAQFASSVETVFSSCAYHYHVLVRIKTEEEQAQTLGQTLSLDSTVDGI